MKKVVVTSSFEGHVTLVYGEAGVGAEFAPPLLYVDFREAVLDDVQKAWMVRHIPVRLGVGFEQSWGAGKLRFAVSDQEVLFDEFWERYNKKINRLRAEKEWNKLKTAERLLAYITLGAYDRYLLRSGYRGKKDPEGYLKNRMWTTEWDKL